MKHIAYVITPHGYGHATRSIAIMDAWQRRDPEVVFHVVTAVKPALFRETLGDRFVYHRDICDVGLIQQDALKIDEAATVAALAALLEPGRGDVKRIAGLLREQGIERVVCDIAPLGLLAAREAGIPSVLVENFTWDFIYQGYAAQAPQVAAFAPRFAQVFKQADVHIQIEPPSQPNAAAKLVPPVARVFREDRSSVRERLGIAADQPLVLLTTGGVGHQFDFCKALAGCQNVAFLVSGQTAFEAANVIHLDGHWYHPDLVLAADLVVGKIGYSTLAETYHAGTPFAYIRRPDFIEGVALKQFADTRMSAVEIELDAFLSGAWLARLPQLLSLKPQRSLKANGAEAVVNYLS